MADKFVFSNFAVSSLSEAIGPLDTELLINIDDVPKFPTVTSGAKFPLVLVESDEEVEILWCTALSLEGVATVQRGMEGTLPRAWLAGTHIRHTFTAATIVGAAGLHPMGAWSAATPYESGDLVTHGGISYVAVNPNLNSAPSSISANWQIIYQPPGAASTAMNFLGAWSSSTTYDQGQVVIYRGRTWLANAESTNSPPAFGNANWTHLAKWSGKVHFQSVLAFAGTNNYTVAIDAAEAPTELFDGMTFRGVFENTNTNASTTVQINALAAIPLKIKPGTNFAVGELRAGEIYEFTYNAATGHAVALLVPQGTAIAALQTQVAALQAALALANPVGHIADWPANAPPAGWLACQGQAVSRVTYALLFAVIGTKYGAGDGVNTFTLPDFRGRVSAGRDALLGGAYAERLSTHLGQNVTIVGSVGGSQFSEMHTHSVNDPSHDHPIILNDPGHIHTETGATNITTASGPGSTLATVSPATTGLAVTGISADAAPAFTGVSIQAQFAGLSGNIQPTIVMEKIIYAGA